MIFLSQDVEKQLRDVAAAKAALDAALLQCQGDVAALRAQLDDSRRDKDQAENVFKQQVLDRGLQLLGEALKSFFYLSVYLVVVFVCSRS